MKWLDVAQGSQEWIDARLGVPTASCFDRLLTPKTLKLSDSSHKYLCELLAERVLRRQVVDFGSMWAERGTEMEREAVAYYELVTGLEARPCGLALTDDGRVGASPDRMVGADGLLECKSPAAHTHVGYLIFGMGSTYRLQLQGQLWVTGRKWVDFLSHCPEFPPVLLRVLPDAEVFKALDVALDAFCADLDAYGVKLARLMAGDKLEAIA